MYDFNETIYDFDKDELLHHEIMLLANEEGITYDEAISMYHAMYEGEW